MSAHVQILQRTGERYLEQLRNENALMVQRVEIYYGRLDMDMRDLKRMLERAIETLTANDQANTVAIVELQTTAAADLEQRPARIEEVDTRFARLETEIKRSTRGIRLLLCVVPVLFVVLWWVLR